MVGGRHEYKGMLGNTFFWEKFQLDALAFSCNKNVKGI